MYSYVSLLFQVLNLLSIAWERRLIFTIGRSVTTGREDVVTWNGVEHRTERSQFVSQQETAHFLERVVRQLNMRGVSDGQDEQGLYQELSWNYYTAISFWFFTNVYSCHVNYTRYKKTYFYTLLLLLSVQSIDFFQIHIYVYDLNFL